MSVKVMSRVWDDSKAEGSALLLLLAIADHCHDDGTGAWPSIATLAKKIRLGERNTQYQIRKLEKMGELRTIIRGGPKGCNSYLIPVQPIAGVQSIAGVQNSASGGAIQRRGGCNPASKTVQPIAPDPSGTIQEPSKNHPRARGGRLHGIPSSLEEVIEAGAKLHPKVTEDRCREFWSHYEGQARTSPSGDVFWVTSGEAVITNWRAKLPTFARNGFGGNKTPTRLDPPPGG